MTLTDPIAPGPRRASRRAAARFERRRDEIVQVATALLIDRGVRGMTTADVAARLELVPTAVSYYFRRKEDLAAACFLRALEVFTGFIEAAAAVPDAPARLRRFFHVFAAFQSEVALGRAAQVAPFNDVRTIGYPAVDVAYVVMFKRLRALLDDPAAPRLCARERNARAHLVLSQAFWAVLWLQRYDARDHQRMIDRLVDILLGGLSAWGAPWAPQPLTLPEPDDGGGEIGRATFLRAATSLINERGYLGASVQKISEALNVTKGAFYHYNVAKDDLVVECFDATLKLMRAAQEAADGATGDGLSNMAAVASALVRNEVSGVAPLLRTSALTAVPAAMREVFIQRLDRVSARFASVLSDGIADGSVRQVDPNVASHMLTAAINAGAELHHWCGGVTPDEALAAYVRPLFEGVFAPPALPPEPAAAA